MFACVWADLFSFLLYTLLQLLMESEAPRPIQTEQFIQHLGRSAVHHTYNTVQYSTIRCIIVGLCLGQFLMLLCGVLFADIGKHILPPYYTVKEKP